MEHMNQLDLKYNTYIEGLEGEKKNMMKQVGDYDGDCDCICDYIPEIGSCDKHIPPTDQHCLTQMELYLPFPRRQVPPLCQNPFLN